MEMSATEALRQQSTSPPPEPPPASSNIRGRRAEAFEKLLDNALEATFAKVSYDNFSACFPTWAAYKARTLADFHGKFVGRLRTTCNENFESIIEDRKVVPTLNSLDNLIADAIARKEAAEAEASASGNLIKTPSPPHSWPADALFAAHLAPFLTQQTSTLGGQLSSVEEQNISLAETVAQQNREIDMLVGNLETVIRDLEAAAALAQGTELQGLSQETRDMSNELHANHAPT
ncbi:hypothetical protein BT63DRAFT_450970 [Microthyrium microscopicum]|uniref:Nnf1-domain-containing protein n=1 Tax=Microthyrium microscopicum TaxID=703497 RepID=A0A6A6UN66_9PEZI|nr:hypothetical protein BT63DRAFT_450970 [Microthyrium microscopicum]